MAGDDTNRCLRNAKYLSQEATELRIRLAALGDGGHIDLQCPIGEHIHNLGTRSSHANSHGETDHPIVL